MGERREAHAVAASDELDRERPAADDFDCAQAGKLRQGGAAAPANRHPLGRRRGGLTSSGMFVRSVSCTQPKSLVTATTSRSAAR